MSREQVNRAFEQLLESVEGDVSGLQDEGARQLKFGNYEGARESIRHAEKVAAFRRKIKSLQNEWARVEYRAPADGPAEYSGERTPEEAFRRPILQAIHEKGGKASMDDVWKYIEQKFSTVLNEYDRQPLPGAPERQRWQNTVLWCRNALIEEEYLVQHPAGQMLELTSKARAALGKEGDIPRPEPQPPNGPAPKSDHLSPKSTVKRF